MIYYLSVLLLVLPPVRMLSFFLMIPPPPRSTLFPYTTLFRSRDRHRCEGRGLRLARRVRPAGAGSGLLHLRGRGDRKSTRLNSSHVAISYAVFCLKKKTNETSKTAGRCGIEVPVTATGFASSS